MLCILKALYQHIVAKIEIVTFSDVFCIFLGQENGMSVYAIRISRLFYCALSVTKSKCTTVRD